MASHYVTLVVMANKRVDLTKLWQHMDFKSGQSNNLRRQNRFNALIGL